MERRFFSGNTLEQAVLAAARFYRLEPESVAYVPREKKHGFVNTRRRIVIEVNPQAPERSAEQVAAARAEAQRQADLDRQQRQSGMARQARGPRSSGPPRSGGRSDGGHRSRKDPDGNRGANRHDNRQDNRGGRRDFGGRNARDESAGEVIENVAPFEGIDELSEKEAVIRAIAELVQLTGLELQASVELSDDGYKVDLRGADSDLLLEESGQLLSIMEHLLPRMARGYCGRGLLCSIDSEGYRAKHEEELRKLALDSANEVRGTEDEIELEPMSPADRRIIHITLADEPGIETESQGSGFFKCVTIYAD